MTKYFKKYSNYVLVESDPRGRGQRAGLIIWWRGQRAGLYKMTGANAVIILKSEVWTIWRKFESLATHAQADLSLR